MSKNTAKSIGLLTVVFLVCWLLSDRTFAIADNLVKSGAGSMLVTLVRGVAMTTIVGGVMAAFEVVREVVKYVLVISKPLGRILSEFKLEPHAS